MIPIQAHEPSLHNFALCRLEKKSYNGYHENWCKVKQEVVTTTVQQKTYEDPSKNKSEQEFELRIDGNLKTVEHNRTQENAEFWRKAGLSKANNKRNEIAATFFSLKPRTYSNY